MAATLADESSKKHRVRNGAVSDADFQSLLRAIVFLTRQLNRPCEEAEASRILSEVVRTQPGLTRDLWWTWLLSAGRSLGLTLRVSDVPPRDLPAILQSGVGVVAERHAAADRQLDLTQLDSQRIVLVGSLLPVPPGPPASSAEESLIRLVIPVRESDLTDLHQRHEKPWVVLWKLLAPDRKDLLAVVAMTGVAGLLMLSVPVTAQQLVRTVTFATFYQPIVVLSLMLLALLSFVAALQALQVFVAEIIQRRLFIRITGQITRQLTQADLGTWKQQAMPELVNRFLEVAIVQKVTAALLVDGIAILLTTLIGMTVMAFYHPFLLGYDILLLVLLATIFFGFGRHGVKTAIQESRTKYSVLSWLEDMARCPGIFRTGGVELLAMQRTDVLGAHFLQARRAHFSILMRQIVLILILQVFATTTLLGLGGFLVLNEQLTLGQLVAAELIVAMIVASFAKVGKHLEGWYDLLASVDKLSHLLHLPPEPHDGLIGLSDEGPAEIVIRGKSNRQPESQTGAANQTDLFRVAAGETAALLNWNPSLVQEIVDGLRGLRGGSGSTIELDGVQIDDVRNDVLRQHVAVASELEFLPGTIAENIHLSRPEVTDANVSEACDAVGLREELNQSGLTLSTQLLPTGWPLDALQQRRLILARALAGMPRVLVIDHLCDAFCEAEVRRLWQQLSRYQSHTTILVATVREDIAQLAGNLGSNSFLCAPTEAKTH